MKPAFFNDTLKDPCFLKNEIQIPSHDLEPSVTWLLLIFPACFYFTILDTLILSSLQFFRCAMPFRASFLCSHCFHLLECSSSCTSYFWGIYLVLLPPLPGNHYFLHAPTESGTIVLLMLYSFMWHSSSAPHGSFSCILWYLI